jgi:putative ABC transport system permease protein
MIGLAIGIVLTLMLTRFMTEHFWLDPLTYAAVTLALVSIALLACYVPAHRATRVDPMVTPRHE